MADSGVNQPTLWDYLADPKETDARFPDLVLGQLALERNLLTRKQLDECLRDAAPLTDAIRARSLIGAETLDALVREQRSRAHDLPTLERYEVLSLVGKGGVGIVYRAHDRELDRPVAVKLLHEPYARTAQIRKRFLREGRIMAGLNHPAVVKVHDVGEAEGRLFLVMELVEGSSLGDLLRAPNPDRRKLVDLLERAARGVSAAQQIGIVHRDLKPENILLKDGEHPKVIDFGLARGAGMSNMTRSGTAIGTPLYMAPEQVNGDEVTSRTDVYALGAILYEILTGRPPHVGETVAEILGAIVTTDPVPPSRIEKDVPPDLELVCMKALDSDPERRYPTAGDMADDLKRHLCGETVLVPRPSRAGQLWKRMRRHRTAVGFLAGAAVLLAAAVVFFAVKRVASDRERTAARFVLEAERRYGAGNYAAARRSVEQAFSVLPGHPPARYWLTRLKVRDYLKSRGLPEARVVRGQVEILPARSETEPERALREDIERELERRERSELEKGILSLCRRDPAGARRLLAKVPAETPAAWEAEIYCAVASYLLSDFEDVLDRLRPHRGRDPDLTLPLWIRSLIALAQARERIGRDPTSLYQQALGACQELATTEGKILEARLLVAWGRTEASTGLDPEPKYETAIERVRDVEEDEAHAVLGDAWMARAEFRNLRGRLDRKDPAEYRHAIEAYSRMTAGGGDLRIAEACLARFLFLERIGQWAIGDLQESKRRFEKALERNPGHADASLGLVEARKHIRLLSATDQKERWDSYEEAIAACGEVIGRHPDYAPAYRARGETRKYYAMKLLRETGASGDHFLRALDDFSRALKVDPRDIDSFILMGLTHLDIAIALIMDGGDPSAETRLAIDVFRKCLEVNPRSAEAYRNLGAVYTVRSARRQAMGEDPIEDLETAVEHLGRAADINPGDHSIFMARASAWRRIALARTGSHADPGEAFDRAIEDYDRVLALVREHLDARAYRGAAYVDRALLGADQGRDPEPDLERGMADLDAVLRLNPSDPRARLWRGKVLVHRGRCEEALKDLRAAVLSRPQLQQEADPWIRRAERERHEHW